jgi:hypothetical protein
MEIEFSSAVGSELVPRNLVHSLCIATLDVSSSQTSCLISRLHSPPTSSPGSFARHFVGLMKEGRFLQRGMSFESFAVVVTYL